MEDEKKRAMLEAIQKLSGQRFGGSNFDEEYGPETDEDISLDKQGAYEESRRESDAEREALGLSEKMSGMLSEGQQEDYETEDEMSEDFEDDSNDFSLDALRKLSSDNSAEPEGEYTEESYDDDYGMRTYGPEDTKENPLEEDEDDEYKLDGYSRK